MNQAYSGLARGGLGMERGSKNKQKYNQES